MKRGIIHLYKIDILFLDKEFEHDIYELDPVLFIRKVRLHLPTKKKGQTVIFISGSKSRMIPV